MREKIKNILIAVVVLMLMIIRSIRAPGDSGAPPTTTTEQAVIASVTIPAQISEAAPEPYSITYKDVTFTEGETIMGELTYYCDCERCCGKWAHVYPRKTADGTLLEPLAQPDAEKVASCNWLPFNAIIEADGQQYRIADRGGKGLNKIGNLDIYVPEGHRAALDMGRLRDVTVRVVSLP